MPRPVPKLTFVRAPASACDKRKRQAPSARQGLRRPDLAEEHGDKCRVLARIVDLKPDSLCNLDVTIQPLGSTAFRFDRSRARRPETQKPTACLKWAELNSARPARVNPPLQERHEFKEQLCTWPFIETALR